MASLDETTTMPPNVLIVGAGVAGLFLGILLERANIPYAIFERASTVKPLGAIMALDVNILPAMEQLGLYEDLKSISFNNPGMHLYNEDMKKIRFTYNEGFKEKVGYDTVLFPRPKFYDLMLARIPTHKIHFGKKVLSIQHPTEGGVSIHCSDNSSYLGDILVGADGTYSGVRQSLYKSLEVKGLLPFSDTQGLKIGYATMVGTTDSLDENKYPELKDNLSHFHFVVGDGKPYTWHTFTVPEKKICWGVQVQLKASVADDMAFRNTTWGPENNETMIKEVYDLATPYGPLGQFIDATPKERTSKVFLEEKLFETWYQGRTVLIGDAAHKMSPSQGQGAVNALQDALILANCLYEIAESATSKNITAAFQSYKEQRYPHVEFQFKSSSFKAKLLFGQRWIDRLLRQLLLGYLPLSLIHKDAIKEAAYRPQCTFLPLTPDRGPSPSVPQKPSRRYTEEQAQRKDVVAV